MNKEINISPVENLQQIENPYKNSEIVSSLVQSHLEGNPLRIAFADIDSTFTGTPEDQKAAYEGLINAGFRIVYVTSRTPEMTIASAAAQISSEFKRPAPKLQKIEKTKTDGTIDAIRDSGAQFVTAYPDQVPSFVGIYGGDATLASTGSEIWIKQTDGSYRLDSDFESQMNINKDTWRQESRAKIDTITKSLGGIGTYAPIEDMSNYEAGKVDVAPPDLRVQMNFKSLDEQLTFMAKMNEEHPEIRVIEDGNPGQGRFQVYMTPERAGKEIAVEDFFQATMREMNRKLPEGQEVVAGDFETVFLGDSWPDFPMGMYGAEGSDATLFLVGGSRLTQNISDTSKEEAIFASENFTHIRDRIMQVANKPGYYEVAERQIILGDEAYPNTKAAQTIATHYSVNS